ncbi:MAG TPA: helix-turn-helix domain-containing protein [Streptosporangiaceae bacterium]|nr:helix-turn-helix domain-containing protein [Streptosporangiaceae bacterium]
MSIGETLARARRDADLSIVEVSSLTGIRLSIIDDIEHDDYSTCGGDHRARANIVAIAGALGVDDKPLIESYNAARRPVGWIAASQSPEPTIAEASQAPAPVDEPALVESAPVDEPAFVDKPAFVDESAPVAAPGPVDEPAPETAAEDTQPITVGQPSEPVVGEPASPLTIGEPASSLTIGEPAYSTMPVETALPTGAFRPVRQAVSERSPLVWIALGGALVAVAALGGILLIVGASGQTARHAIADGRQHSGRDTARPARTHPSPRHSARSPGRTRRASHRGSRPARALVPASIAAFGPGGTGQGDSPQLAHQALADKAAAPWHSAWYTTPHFGNLQSGTGLLLDMGRPVTITSARIALGDHSGADVALRIGSSPSLASLPPVARANGAGGIVRLKTTPTRGRYVLVWFTKLPPDQAGTFQVSVYDIKLSGRP